MSRHGYTDDCDLENWDAIRWRGAVQSALRGKRGQSFLRELIAALDAMPEKKLFTSVLVRKEDGACCALGAVYQARGKSVPESADGDLDEYDDNEWISGAISRDLGIAPAMAKEIMYMNDDFFGDHWEWDPVKKRYVDRATPEWLWQKMREWAVKQLRGETAPESGEGR